MTKSVKAHIALFITNLIYGANFAIAKGVMPFYIGPVGFVTLRVTISCLLFIILYKFFMFEKVNRSDFPKLLLCGLFGVAINQTLFFKGLSITYPINGAIIMTTSPILVLIMAAIIIREKITRRKISGIVLGISGALVLLTSGRSVSFREEAFAGDVFIFINAISYGIFLVIAKPLMFKYKAVTVITWSFITGSLMVIPFGVGEVATAKWEMMDTAIWLGIAYVVFAVTFIAYLLNTIALKTLSPAVVSFYIYLQPLFTTLIALVTGNDTVTPSKIISSLMIFGGIYLISIPAREKF